MSRYSHEHPEEPFGNEPSFRRRDFPHAYLILRRMTAPAPAEPCGECDRSPCACRERCEDAR